MHKRFMFLCFVFEKTFSPNTKHMLACYFLTVLNIFRWIILFQQLAQVSREQQEIRNRGQWAEDRG